MIRFKVIFSPNALIDIEQAVKYYNEQKTGLGKRFAMEVQSTLKSIKSNPFHTSIRFSSIRCANVKFFPFMVHYHINEEKKTVKILSVYNTHREPIE